jgi:hypothetical protein
MIELLLIAVIALQLLDFATTAYALRHKRAVEANPLMARLMKQIGVTPTLILTKGAVAGLAVFLWRIDSIVWLAILTVAYGAVTANNLRLINR